MRNSKLSFLAGAALALATLTSSTSALAEPTTVAKECAQKVMMVAHGSIGSLGNLGDTGIEKLVELRLTGASTELILRTGANIQRAILEEASSTTDALSALSADCTELLLRVGANDLLINRFQSFTDRVNFRIRLAAFFQVTRVARVLQAMV